MKLQTSIKPRKDGNVLATGENGKTYAFQPDENGDLVCDVDHEPTIALLLRTEFFTPVDDGDFAAAIELTAEVPGPDEIDDPDDESDPDALPVEANTPPAPVRRKPGPKPKAK